MHTTSQSHFLKQPGPHFLPLGWEMEYTGIVSHLGVGSRAMVWSMAGLAAEIPG